MPAPGAPAPVANVASQEANRTAAPPAAAFVFEPTPALGTQAVQGAAWTVVFATLGKAAALGTQLALAWLLLPQDFGLAALALSCLTVAGVVCGSSWRNLLVQSPKPFEALAGQVFWLALAAGVAVALVLAALAPVAGTVLHQARLPGLIAVAALAAPLQALTTVYGARLARGLRFRDLARITFWVGLLQNATAVTLAALGLGAYALVIPLSVLAAAQVAGLRRAAGPVAVGRPEPARWPALAAPAGWLMAYALGASLQVYGPNLVVGLAHRDPAVTGYYYWGFVAASQVVFLLATNLQGVFFPAFSRLNGEETRQFQAVRRSLQGLLICVAPVCLLQMVLARPVIGLLFHERWLPAVPVVQWISLALATQPVGMVATASLMARGRFRALAGVAALSATATTAGAAVGALLGNQVQIAQGVAAGFMFANGYAGWRAWREFGVGWHPLAETALPLLAWLALAVFAAAWVVTTPTPTVLAAALAGLVGLSLYAASLKLFLPHVFAEMWQRLNLRRSKKPS